jgi:acyl-CoA reductase-like NAD-dependent aldehyde dehydrogenase
LNHYATLVEASPAVVSEAVERAHRAFLKQRKSTLAERAGWLNAVAAAVDAATDEFVALIVHDIGKPQRAARFETQRAAQFLRACAVEVQGHRGEMVPVDAAPTGAGRVGFTRRVPYGVVAAITPFNAPLNLLVQKVGPAVAAGNSVVAKPHPAGSRVALRLARVFLSARVPENLFSVVTGDRVAAQALVEHPLVAAVSFTGSTAGGDALVRAAGAKKFVAELGSNAANVVLADADVGDAADRIASAAFEASGQQCISAQRIIVEEPVYADFLERFVRAARALKVGAPEDPSVAIGPMVSLAAADRVMAMCEEALARGASYALKPTRRDCFVGPAILVDTPHEALLWCEEAFGPVAVVQPARDVDHALALANDSHFGLQGAVFTRSLRSAYRFADEFDVGSLWVNDASRFRLDMYPFGGMKRSGFGREGVRYAMEELSQHKFVGLRVDI